MSLADLSAEEFENLCDGCGKCCALRVNGTPTYGCPGLNVKTMRCTVYPVRQKKYICLKLSPSNVMDLHKADILPDSCAYVRFEKGEPPLDRDTILDRDTTGTVPLIPFSLAPLWIRRGYDKANRAWLKRLPSSSGPQRPPE